MEQNIQEYLDAFEDMTRGESKIYFEEKLKINPNDKYAEILIPFYDFCVNQFYDKTSFEDLWIQGVRSTCDVFDSLDNEELDAEFLVYIMEAILVKLLNRSEEIIEGYEQDQYLYYEEKSEELKLMLQKFRYVLGEFSKHLDLESYSKKMINRSIEEYIGASAVLTVCVNVWKNETLENFEYYYNPTKRMWERFSKRTLMALDVLEELLNFLESDSTSKRKINVMEWMISMLNKLRGSYGSRVNNAGTRMIHGSFSKEEKQQMTERINKIKEDMLAIDPNNKTAKETEGCYLATMVYGTYDCPELWMLRSFRDVKLYKSRLGRIFIKVYYYTSPKMISIFRDREWFLKINKYYINKIVKRLEKEGYSNDIYFDEYNDN